MAKNTRDEEFDRASYGGSAYDQQYFSDDELMATAAIRAAAEAGDTDWGSAHDYVEAIRKKYGYSGGEDGSKYVALETSGGEGGGKQTASPAPSVSQPSASSPASMPSFTYESAPEYVSQYQDQINALAAEILGREEFSYDHNADPIYSSYKKTYTREGQRAMEDAMGQYASMTGGMPSTAAMMAGQQANNYYMGQMADKIPELYQLAYSMYQDEGNAKRANLDMLMGQEQDAYNKYLAQLDQYNTDRNFQYGVYSDDRAYAYQAERDAISDRRYDTEWQYQLDRDAISDQRYADELAYNREQDEWEKSQYTSETQYSQALQKAQTLAAAGDFSGYAALGYSSAEIASMKAAYDAAMAGSKPSGGSGGGGYSGGGGGGGGAAGSDDDEEIGGNAIPSNVIAGAEEHATSQMELAEYLDTLTKRGTITEAQADELYATWKPANQYPAYDNRQWSVANDGGVNWFWGVDNNAVVRDQWGNEYRMDTLVDELVAGGMSKKAAKDYVKDLQKQLGI